MRKIPGKFLLIASVCALALFLRLYTLSQKSLWYDEACSLQFSCGHIHSIFNNHYLIRALYFLFLNIWTHIFGAGEFVSRLPSVIFGLFSVLSLYSLGKILFGKKAGIIAAFLLAISYFHIAWSQQVRNHSLLVLLCILSSLSYISTIKSARLFGFCAYFISTVLAIFTGNAAVILFLFQVIFFYKLVNTDKIRWSIVFSLILIPVLALPVMAYIFRDCVIEDLLVAKTLGANIPGIWELFKVFGYGGGYIAQGATAYQTEIPSFLAFLSLAATILYISFYAYGVAAGPRNNRQETAYCLGWFWIPFFALFALQLCGCNCFSPKYMIFALPAYYLIIARGLSLLSSKAVLIIALIIMASSSFFNLGLYYNPPFHSSWKEVSAYIKKYIKDPDRIIIIPSQQITPFWFYYKKDLKDFSYIGNGVNGRVRLVNGVWQNEFYDGNNLITGITLDGAGAFIKNNTEKKSDLWIVVSKYWPGLKDYPLFARYMHKEYRLVEKRNFPFEGIEVLKYKSVDK